MRHVTPFRIVLAAILGGFLLFVTVARADEGTGTADFCARHSCGAPQDPTIVTPCPDPPPPTVCPDVTCQATDCSKTTVVVNPTVCPSVTAPAVTFPEYYPCRRVNGKLTCPRKRIPHRVLVPSTTPGIAPY
jgi:hypothetical protein